MYGLVSARLDGTGLALRRGVTRTGLHLRQRASRRPGWFASRLLAPSRVERQRSVCCAA